MCCFVLVTIEFWLAICDRPGPRSGEGSIMDTPQLVGKVGLLGAGLFTLCIVASGPAVGQAVSLPDTVPAVRAPERPGETGQRRMVEHQAEAAGTKSPRPTLATKASKDAARRPRLGGVRAWMPTDGRT